MKGKRQKVTDRRLFDELTTRIRALPEDRREALLQAVPALSAGGRLMYLRRLPEVVPDGYVLVHNNVRPTRRLGSRGFRAWLSTPDAATLDVCPCTWAPELGRHYRVRRARALRATDADARPPRPIGAPHPRPTVKKKPASRRPPGPRRKKERRP